MLFLNKSLALVILACSLPLLPLAQSPSAKVPIPKEIIEQLTADKEDSCSDAKALTASRVDLNDDRIPEIIVRMENHCSCGAGANCTNWVYQKTEVGYVLLMEAESAAKLYPGTNSSKGFKDLISEHTMGAGEIAVTIYQWDGYRYKTSSCLTKQLVGTQQGKPIYKTKITLCDVEESVSTTQERLAPIPKPQELTARPITQQSFSIGAGKFTWFQFVVIGQNARVIGRFQATGGSGNDVEAFILGQDEFVNFQSGHRVNTWFNSGRVTVANIEAQIPPGTYYLVFSNKFSLVSPKAVNASVRLIQ